MQSKTGDGRLDDGLRWYRQVIEGHFYTIDCRFIRGLAPIKTPVKVSVMVVVESNKTLVCCH